MTEEAFSYELVEMLHESGSKFYNVATLTGNRGHKFFITHWGAVRTTGRCKVESRERGLGAAIKRAIAAKTLRGYEVKETRNDRGSLAELAGRFQIFATARKDIEAHIRVVTSSYIAPSASPPPPKADYSHDPLWGDW